MWDAGRVQHRTGGEIKQGTNYHKHVQHAAQAPSQQLDLFKTACLFMCSYTDRTSITSGHPLVGTAKIPPPPPKKANCGAF